jgi:hypothetical protein
MGGRQDADASNAMRALAAIGGQDRSEGREGVELSNPTQAPPNPSVPQPPGPQGPSSQHMPRKPQGAGLSRHQVERRCLESPAGTTEAALGDDFVPQSGFTRLEHPTANPTSLAAGSGGANEWRRRSRKRFRPTGLRLSFPHVVVLRMARTTIQVAVGFECGAHRCAAAPTRGHP